MGMKGNIHMSDVVFLLQQQTKFNANKEELEVNFAVEAPEGGVVGASTITEPPSGDKIKALDSGEGELVQSLKTTSLLSLHSLFCCADFASVQGSDPLSILCSGVGVDDVGVDMSTDNGGAEGGSAVTPWEVEAGEIDYDKLVKAFGSIIITEVSRRSGGLGETWDL
jgi:hypothetical protein